MGVAQSIGGASTSGHGFTGEQVGAALRMATAVQQRGRHMEQPGSDRDISPLSAPLDSLRGTGAATQKSRNRHMSVERGSIASLCEQISVQKLTVEDTTGGESCVLTMTEYAQEVFRHLRHLDAVDDIMFADEWALPDDGLRLHLGEGRSQALFLASKNAIFMCKTISETEVKVLLRVLPSYVAYLAEHPHSFIMRFYMLLKVQVGQEVGFLLCFDDVFGHVSTLNEKWDLKGRIPKPGKYQHFARLIHRPNEPDPYVIDTPKERGMLYSDSTRGDVVLVANEDKHKLSTRHDKDLTRLFWLENPARKQLLDQLFIDYEFLRSVSLMDYSLLIGVSYNDNKTSRSGRPYVVIHSMKKTFPMGAEAEAANVEVRVCTSPATQRRRTHKLHLPFKGGLQSLYDQEVYYVGIIDVLTTYNWKKKTANFCKSFLWKQSTLSTVSPNEYQRRIAKFTKIIFPEVA